MAPRDEQRHYTKMGKKLLYAGKSEGAERCFLRALEIVNCTDTPSDIERGLIGERLAVTAAEMDETELAVRRFKQSLILLESDLMGKAICQRNYAMLELDRGNHGRARKLNQQSLRCLDRLRLSRSTERLDIEVAVARGFLARVELRDGRDIAVAIQTFRDLAGLLRAYDRKPVYELDNLLWLIDVLPPGEERNDHLARAIELSSSLGNSFLQRELQALSVAGEPGRYLYRLGVGIASSSLSFGFNTLKGVIRIFR